MTAAVQGVEQLQRVLQRLSTQGSKRVVRAAVGAANTTIAKAARQKVNSSNATPELKRAARQLIGKRFTKDKQGQPQAKVGFAVGKASKAKKNKAHERSAYGQGGAKLARGVGISASNIHWFAIGTAKRVLKQKRALIPPDEFGDYRVLVPGDTTGRVKPVLSGTIAKAAIGAAGEAVAAAAAKARQVIQQEALKKG